MSLFEQQQPGVDIGRMRILITGAPKVGKSSLLSGVKNVVYLDFEGGLNGLEVVTTPMLADMDPQQAWQRAIDAGRELAEMYQSEHPPAAVVVDTVNMLWDICADATAAEFGKPTIGDIAHGRGWAHASKKFQGYLTRLHALGGCVIMLAHVDHERRSSAKGGEETCAVPAVSGKTGRWLTGWVDAILYMAVGREQQRMMYTTAGSNHVAGVRGLRRPLPPSIEIPPPPVGWRDLRAALEAGLAITEVEGE